MHALMLSDYTFSLRSHIRARSPDYPSVSKTLASRLISEDYGIKVHA